MTSAAAENRLMFVLLCLMTSLCWTQSQDVRIPPSVVSGPSVLIQYKENANVTLICVGSGYPTPVYEWTKNGQPLNVNAGNIHQSPGVGTIVIYPINAQDEGYYQCIISNAHGKTMTNVTFVQMAILQTFPPYTEPTEVNIDVHGYKCLYCTQLESIPPSKVFWTYNFTGNTGPPIPVIENNRTQTDPNNGHLCLNYVEVEDGNKIYICNHQNTVLDRIESGDYTSLTVGPGTYPNMPPNAMFIAPNRHTIGFEGEPMTMRCMWAGSPTPTVSWSYYGRLKVPVSDRWQVTHSGTGLTLIDGRLTPEDFGDYICWASNGVTGSPREYHINITVYARPVFLSIDHQPHDVNMTEGDTVSISCDPRAVPNVTSIVWFKDGVQLNPDSLPPKYSLTEDLKLLTIENLCKTCSPSDLTSIQCNASSEYGFAFGQGYVNVLEATAIHSVGGNRPWVPSSIEVFDCEATTDDSTTLTLSWFFNQVPVQEGQTIYVAANGSLVVDMRSDADAGKSRIGEYECQATNGYSQAQLVHTLQGEDVTNEMQCVHGQNACVNKKLKNPDTPSGTYHIGTVFGNVIEVYCSMDSIDGGGYTFINPTYLSQLTSDEVALMFNNKTSFRFCYRTPDSIQYCAILKQLPQYAHIPLKVGLSENTGYKDPINVDDLKLPYLYFGFLPIDYASNGNVQGIRVNGINVSFTNCDATPSSQMTLFPNYSGFTPSAYLENTTWPFCDQIFVNCVRQPVERYLPEYFFMFGEFYFGGCGCYTQTNRLQNVVGIAIGFK